MTYYLSTIVIGDYTKYYPIFTSGDTYSHKATYYDHLLFISVTSAWSLSFFKIYLLIFGGGERETQREILTCCSTYLYIHWLLLVCALTRDWTHNLGILGWCYNQLSYLARAIIIIIFNSHMRTFFFLGSWLLEREEVRQKERERNKERRIDWLPPIHSQTGDHIPLCPDQGWHPQPFSHGTKLQPTEPQWPEPSIIFNAHKNSCWNRLRGSVNLPKIML